MIKTILSTFIVALIFTGCVGTVVANNQTKESSVRNAKPQEADKNNTKIDNNTTSLKEIAIDKAVEVADVYTDGKASVLKSLIK